jgi:hypothetical protein
MEFVGLIPSAPRRFAGTGAVEVPVLPTIDTGGGVDGTQRCFSDFNSHGHANRRSNGSVVPGTEALRVPVPPTIDGGAPVKWDPQSML